MLGSRGDRAHDPAPTASRAPEGRRQEPHPGARRLLGRDDPAPGLTEADFRGERFADHHSAEGQQRPSVPDPAGRRRRAARRLFRRRRRHQRDQHLQLHRHRPGRLRACRARCATSTWPAPASPAQVADRWTAKTPDKPRFVAGSIGPLNRTLSMSLGRQRSRRARWSPSTRSTTPIANRCWPCMTAGSTCS